MTLDGWPAPERIAEAEKWMRHAAAAHGRPLAGVIERIHMRPWSTVCRAPTATSALILKVCHAVQAFEPALTEIVAREQPGLTPELIARHPTEPWMILVDGGMRLRDARSGSAWIDAWTRLLPRYAELQRALVGREADLRSAGVPDRRLDRLASLLGQILADERAAPIDVRRRLRDLLPRIERGCADLAAYGIGASLDHADLHDNNVLERDGRLTIIDWGDAGVTHPFLSWFVTLRFAERAGGDAAELRRLRDAYFEPWTSDLHRRDLERAADLGAALGTIPGVLTWYGITREIDGVQARDPGEMAVALDQVSASIEGLPVT